MSDPLPISPEMQTKLQAAEQAKLQKAAKLGQVAQQLARLEREYDELIGALDTDIDAQKRLLREAAISVGIDLDKTATWNIDMTTSPWTFRQTA